MSLSVKYYDAPVVSINQITPTSTGVQSFSEDSSLLTGLAGIPFATLETGGWPLDGSRRLMKETPGGYWWSAQSSDEAGVLAQPAVLTLQLDTPITATGITFTFWPAANQWCSHMKVSWYNATVLLQQSEVYPDSPRWTLTQAVEGFDKVRIELCATNLPGQFAKLEMLELGQVWLFEDKDLVSVQLVNEIDPLLSELTVDTMQIKLHNSAGKALLPLENQRPVLYREDKPVATHYITGSSRETKDTYTLQAQSTIGLLGDSFLGGFYKNTAVSDLLTKICKGYGYVLDPAFSQTCISGYLPVSTCREALQQVMFAIGAVVSAREDGVLHIRPPAQNVEGIFSDADIFQGAKITTRPRYSRIEVGAHS